MTKAEVCEAFREAMTRDYADVPAKEEISHVFSAGFYGKMDALIAEQKRGSWRLLNRRTRRTLVVAALLAAAVLLTACSPKLREAVTELAVTVYETFARFTVSGKESGLRAEIETVYGFDPLPEGFTLIEEIEGNDRYIERRYQGKAGVVLIFSQEVVTAAVGTVDKEAVAVSAEVVGEAETMIVITEEFGRAVWMKGGYRFQLDYVGKAEKEDLIELVLRVNPVGSPSREKQVKP